jgi:hypothetical protein
MGKFPITLFNSLADKWKVMLEVMFQDVFEHTCCYGCPRIFVFRGTPLENERPCQVRRFFAEFPQDYGGLPARVVVIRR